MVVGRDHGGSRGRAAAERLGLRGPAAEPRRRRPQVHPSGRDAPQSRGRQGAGGFHPRRRCPDAEIVVHPYSGEAGAIGAALCAADRGDRSIDDAVPRIRRHRSRSTTSRRRTRTPPVTGVRSRASARSSTCVCRMEMGGRGARCRSTQAGSASSAATRARRGWSRTSTRCGWSRRIWRRSRMPTPTRLRWFGRTPSAPTRLPERSGPGRATLRVGIPRVLNLWSTHQFWIGFLGGARHRRDRQIEFSSDSSEEQAREFGKGRGTVDCCYPVKCISGHYGELLARDRHHKIDLLLSPMISSLPSFLGGHVRRIRCPARA